MTDAFNNVTMLAYDKGSNVTIVTDRPNHVTTYAHVPPGDANSTPRVCVLADHRTGSGARHVDLVVHLDGGTDAGVTAALRQHRWLLPGRRLPTNLLVPLHVYYPFGVEHANTFGASK
jgi:hypothetical protein